MIRKDIIGMKKLFKKVKAFTLAEILIALTVIGIVSALTIPNLSKNIQTAQSKTAFKKTLAEINTAIADFTANEGKNLAQVGTNGEIQAMFENYMGAKAVTDTARWPVVVNLKRPQYTASANAGVINLSNTTNVVSKILNGTSSGNTELGNYTYYTLPNSVGLLVPATTDTNYLLVSCGSPRLLLDTNPIYVSQANNACLIFIDTNGRKGPNQQIMGVTSTSGDVDACAKIVVPEGDYMLQAGTGSNAKYCELTDDAVTDIYPVVLFNNKAYPATVAGYWVLNDLIGQDI